MLFDPSYILPTVLAICLLAILVWMMYRKATTHEWAEVSGNARQERKAKWAGK